MYIFHVAVQQKSWPLSPPLVPSQRGFEGLRGCVSWIKCILTSLLYERSAQDNKDYQLYLVGANNNWGFMSKGRPPEPLDFFIWTAEDVGVWLEEIGLGTYKQTFQENGINGEYLDNLSTFTTEQILRFIRRCHMKWGDFITLCKELRNVKVACLKGEQEVRRPWWAPSCLSSVFVKLSKHTRQSRVASLKFDP